MNSFLINVQWTNAWLDVKTLTTYSVEMTTVFFSILLKPQFLTCLVFFEARSINKGFGWPDNIKHVIVLLITETTNYSQAPTLYFKYVSSLHTMGKCIVLFSHKCLPETTWTTSTLEWSTWGSPRMSRRGKSASRTRPSRLTRNESGSWASTAVASGEGVIVRGKPPYLCCR